MTTWLSRLKKLLAAPPADGTATPDTPFQAKARDMLKTEQGALALKELLLVHKGEAAPGAPPGRRRLVSQQLDQVEAVLKAFAAERSILEAKAARESLRAELAQVQDRAGKELATALARRDTLHAELAQLQARLAPLEQHSAQAEQALVNEHQARVRELQARLEAAELANDAAAADAASAELSTELRDEAARRSVQAGAPNPAELRARVLRDSAERKRAELEQADSQVSAARASLATAELDAADLEYHDSAAAAILALARATAEASRWGGQREAVQGRTLRAVDANFTILVTRPELVPAGERVRAYRGPSNRWEFDRRVLELFLAPLFADVRVDLFARDTTRPWPEELEWQAQAAAGRAAAPHDAEALVETR